MTVEMLIAAGAGWWVVWVFRPVLVPALDRFWRALLKNVEL